MSSDDESSESCSSSEQVDTASESNSTAVTFTTSTSSEDCGSVYANRYYASAACGGKALQKEYDVSGESETTWSVAASSDWVKHVGDVSPLQSLRTLRILLPCAGWDAPSQALHALGGYQAHHGWGMGNIIFRCGSPETHAQWCRSEAIASGSWR